MVILLISIFGTMEKGAGSTDDNIYLRLDANRGLYFGWGRQGAVNELYFGALNTTTLVWLLYWI